MQLFKYLALSIKKSEQLWKYSLNFEYVSKMFSLHTTNTATIYQRAEYSRIAAEFCIRNLFNKLSSKNPTKSNNDVHKWKICLKKVSIFHLFHFPQHKKHSFQFKTLFYIAFVLYVLLFAKKIFYILYILYIFAE